MLECSLTKYEEQNDICVEGNRGITIQSTIYFN